MLDRNGNSVVSTHFKEVPSKLSFVRIIGKFTYIYKFHSLLLLFVNTQTCTLPSWYINFNWIKSDSRQVVKLMSFTCSRQRDWGENASIQRQKRMFDELLWMRMGEINTKQDWLQSFFHVQFGNPNYISITSHAFIKFGSNFVGINFWWHVFQGFTIIGIHIDRCVW